MSTRPVAEDAILQYMKKVVTTAESHCLYAPLNICQMNRPFGAVDISANLKGAVPKATTVKILVSLADKGAIVQKTYGICALKR